MPLPDQYRVFQHLTEPKAELYRAILRVFSAAKNHFEISLRSGEIAERLTAADEIGSQALRPEEVDDALRQLRKWGNLEASQDNADVQTVEEFNRTRLLYQFSAAGETAEQALAFFDQNLIRPGELQSTALQEIYETLEELRALLAIPPLDEAKAIRSLRSLTERFHQLTTRAQSFMRSVQKGIIDPAGSVDVFLQNKEVLFDYLEHFIGQLNLATHRISEALRAIDRVGMEQALHAAAVAELADALNLTQEQKDEMQALWRSRWEGVCHWFLGTQGQLSQAEILRIRARSAIPALLETVRRLNDQRSDRSDRAKDFVTLARWFATAASEDDAHRLWRTAFALTSSRHLRVNDETLTAWDDTRATSRTTWCEAPPYHLSPRLRETGRAAPRGPARAVVDRSAEREQLAAIAEAEQRAWRDACQSLVSTQPRQLSELSILGTRAAELLLDLIGEALARCDETSCTTSPVEATSEDGSLKITLDGAPPGKEAVIHTDVGILRGPDYRVHIRLAEGALPPRP